MVINRFILIIVFFLVIGTGFLLSYGSIPNQEGYVELSWNLNHLNFRETLFHPMTTPLNFLVALVIERILSTSTAAAWKIMDLTFAGFIAVFITKVYWNNTKPKLLFDKFMPVLIITTSVGFIYSFTSMSGEGMPVFFALLGVYYWNKKRFIRASLLFILSFLSKYTIYLIAPGLILWTVFQLKYYSKKELKQIFVAGILFLSSFFLYHSLKQWVDFKLHLPYISNLSPQIILNNFPPYLMAIIMGAPIIAIFSFLYPSFTNLFWLCGFSCLIMLLRRYFCWNHSQQIITFWMLYFFSHPNIHKILQKRFMLLQSIFFFSLIVLLPINSGGLPIFYKHITKYDSYKIEEEINRDYHGGKVGYYGNRRFDVPFPNYEISYMAPDWDFVIKDTEYVVIPSIGIPGRLLDFKECKYIYYKQIGLNAIYKVDCGKSPTTGNKNQLISK